MGEELLFTRCWVLVYEGNRESVTESKTQQTIKGRGSSVISAVVYKGLKEENNKLGIKINKFIQ